VLYPSYSLSDLRFWSELYSCGTQYIPTGSSEHSLSLVPVR
ncbi:unnamed protein product, partial [Rotaria sordida]